MTKSQIIQTGDIYHHTYHSSVRANQRGVSNNEILFVIQNSKPLYKQGLCFYSLKNSIYYTEKFLNDNIINLVVITDDQSSTILTVYKSAKAWGKIKHKPKRLSIKNNYS